MSRRKEIHLEKIDDEQRKGATVLLVDDDVELLQFEAKFLSAHYHILIAENGIQALEQLKKNRMLT